MNNKILPKVSVVIPVYNVEKYLKGCIDSVLNQTLTDIEVLCIDDFSLDNSLTILKEYEGYYPHIRVFRNTGNRGPSYSRNKGISNANGKYIYFLDSDDMIIPSALEVLYNKAEAEGVDIIYFDAELLYETDELAQKHNNYITEHKRSYKGIYTGEMLFTKQIMNEDWSPSPPRQFFNAEFLKRNHILFYEGILHEDHLFWFTAAIKAKCALCIYDKLFIRRYRANSIMTVQKTIKNLEGLFTCYSEILSLWKKSNFKPETNMAITKYMNILITEAKDVYDELIRREGKVELQTKNAAIQYLYKAILEKEKRRCLNIEDKINIMKRHDNVIIYGAGVVAREVIGFLDRYNIGILGCAVSDKNGNADYVLGNKVYQINDLMQFIHNSLVIIATTKRYYFDINEQLIKLGFKNILYALDAEEDTL